MFDCARERVYAVGSMFQFIISVLVLGFGAVFAWLYLGASPSARSGSSNTPSILPVEVGVDAPVATPLALRLRRESGRDGHGRFTGLFQASHEVVTRGLVGCDSADESRQCTG